jgi:hypothetical protein
MRQFWVVGGEYESTAFKNLAEGSTEVREGPFDDYDKALKEWQRLAWETVDDCNAHFHIEEEDVDFGAAGAYWVIGGTFKDTSFKEWAGVPERFGPYASYAEAEGKWQEMAWSTVDDATAQYRIETIKPKAEEETASKERLAYRLLTGLDSREFCKKVSKALADGYVLYGDPSMTTVDGNVRCAQAVILPEHD